LIPCLREGGENGENVFARGSCVRENWLKGGKRVRERVLRTRKRVKRGETCSQEVLVDAKAGQKGGNVFARSLSRARKLSKRAKR
jgi:hypothetical protein